MAVRVLTAAVLVALLLPVIAWACPLCKEEVPDNGPSMWRGMYWSILLMVGMPFTAALTIVVLVLRARRRHPNLSPPGVRLSPPGVQS